ncbi:MAG: hypothetical protein AUH71_06465 [Thaumarchaeota archaeon 13_1_40CM_4_48_7]|nr:MAG: hypothetical protein AUH71_06465 [Thaumarchaeota archaeon 13_1_40CM_4_48_7]OLC91629.1 MAG: hypothetical protein AUI92_07315 [Thaumarchaeota archaeon 13_1_40CM_3_38_6]
MEKWADYGISKVHYDSDPKRMAEVVRMKDNGDKFGAAERRSGEQVIQDIKSPISYITLRRGTNGWSKGSPVEIVKHSDNEEFIRSEGNATDRDNLGELEKY